ncbi:MAG TPA: CYTH domain-containing protein [Mucilaginibacter sp.]|nr:CYTH domain-containing protein [Mucilaginibacter sp.]
MGVEIERKFLVDHAAWGRLNKPAGVRYKQGYMLNEKDRTVRIRVSDDRAYLNLKSRSTAVSRKEYEYEIPLRDGLEILEHFTQNHIEKVRYDIPFSGKTWEVDVFEGDNAGLIVAEIELKSEDEEFEKPTWVTAEVTDDARYTNASLVKHPFKTWDR